MILKRPGFSGEHDRWERVEGLEHGVKLLLARVLRQLQSLLRFPALNGPFTGPGISDGGGGGGLRWNLRLVGGDDGVFCRLGGVDGEDGGIGPGFGLGPGEWRLVEFGGRGNERVSLRG